MILAEQNLLQEAVEDKPLTDKVNKILEKAQHCKETKHLRIRRSANYANMFGDLTISSNCTTTMLMIGPRTWRKPMQVQDGGYHAMFQVESHQT